MIKTTEITTTNDDRDDFYEYFNSESDYQVDGGDEYQNDDADYRNDNKSGW